MNNNSIPDDLEKRLKENAEFAFQHYFGNALNGVLGYATLLNESEDCAKRAKWLETCQLSKEKFYRTVDEFLESDFTPKGKINRETIRRFYDFRELNWTNMDTVNTIRDYYSSLIH